MSLCPDEVVLRLPVATSWDLAVKRVIDSVGAALGLVMLLPVMAAIAVAIKLDSKGPVFFRQLRIGQGGRPFWILKFRTMVPDAEARMSEVERLNESPGGLLVWIPRDPRVTFLGRVLRRSSLDEIPQLVNVVRGEMSLVGPRPLQARDHERLVEQYPDLAVQRLAAMPGLTGLAQVSGRREITPQEILMLDREYVESRSIMADLVILVQTIRVVITGRGAV